MQRIVVGLSRMKRRRPTTAQNTLARLKCNRALMGRSGEDDQATGHTEPGASEESPEGGVE